MMAEETERAFPGSVFLVENRLSDLTGLRNVSRIPTELNKKFGEAALVNASATTAIHPYRRGITS